MPNTKVVRSYKASGMSKYTDGGVPAQGIPEGANTTYPQRTLEGIVKEALENGPVNEQYRERIPTTIEPLGSVDVGPVSQGGKKS